MTHTLMLKKATIIHTNDLNCFLFLLSCITHAGFLRLDEPRDAPDHFSGLRPQEVLGVFWVKFRSETHVGVLVQVMSNWRIKRLTFFWVFCERRIHSVLFTSLFNQQTAHSVFAQGVARPTESLVGGPDSAICETLRDIVLWIARCIHSATEKFAAGQRLHLLVRDLNWAA